MCFGIKKKRGVVTHTLVPSGSFKNIADEKIKVTDIFIKEMPEAIQFKGSLWIVGDAIIHFSGNPPFIVLIKHEAIVSGIKSLYNFVWNMSEPKHRPNENY
jgi:hypothetical protein